MTEKIDCSVIVPAYNAEKTIGRCLQSLLRQETGGKIFEIIVVDDGSMDATPEWVAQCPAVRYLWQPHQGAARARNFGVENAQGGIILFTDADCEAAPDWLSEMVRPFENPEIAGVKGEYRTRQREWVAHVVQMEYEGKYRKMLKDPYIDFIDTYSAAFRKEILLKAGGFDTSFPNASVEDQEFSFRLSCQGHKMVFNPRAVVFHRHSATLRSYIVKKFRIGYWKIRVLKRYPKKIWRDSHTPQILKIEILFSFLSLLAFFAGALLANREMLACGLAFFASFAALACFEMRYLFLKSVWMGISSILVLLLRSLALGSGLLYGIRKV